MTEDKNFKIKVREVAELNDLSYTEAKKAIIELDRRIDELDLRNSGHLESFVAKSDDSNYVSLPASFTEKLQGKFFPLKNPGNTPQFLELSTNKTSVIDFTPLRNGVKSGVSNIYREQAVVTSSADVRLLYSIFAEQFERENTYFIDRENFFSQMPKLIKTLKKYDGKNELLVGVMSPDPGMMGGTVDRDSIQIRREWDEQISVYKDLINQIVKLVQDKKIFIISDAESFSLLNADQHNVPTKTWISSSLALSDTQIQYYPFDKTHGGSYHRTTNKQILGHINGETKFLSSKMTLIENDDSSCIENIHAINKDDCDFIRWNNRDDMLKSQSLDSGGRLFLKIGFEMTKEELDNFLRHLYDNWVWNYMYNTNKRYKESDKDQIVIESPDAEFIYSYFEDKNEMFSECAKKYTLVDESLYSYEGEKISLYKTDKR